ncbi:DHH family phosphoesterase [Halostella pelagica]|uniref:DHH family phosphoesterase n=1 Tax=Halostella pelagica TaxID=2583824 RepID=UPI001081F3D0|nr:DHH family phosphoesterase [Halostella pelagica]
MVSRLVLGCGAVGQRLVEKVALREGDLDVICGDSDRVETLRNESVRAQGADPTDPAVVEEIASAPDVVLIAGDDPEHNVRMAQLAEVAFPDAFRMAYAGVDATDAQRAKISEAVDSLVDPGGVMAEYVANLVASEAGTQSRRLRRTLRRVGGRLAIVTHDNPDPDAIASAVALSRLAASIGVESTLCYYGEISHQENRALVNLLDLDLRQLAPDEGVSEFDGVALVDHSRPGVNDQLPEDTEVDVVIDHHPPRAPVEAKFVDLRSDVGATSTLLTGYLNQFGLELDTTVATALLYGIRVDTADFSREVSAADFQAAATLLPHADAGILERVEMPSISQDTFNTIAQAIRHQVIEDDVLCSYVGDAVERDALAQAADKLLEMEGINATVVYGLSDGVVYLSARSRGTDLDLGETLRSAYDQIGSAGGHADMAGAQIPLGVIGEVEDDERLEDVIRNVVTDRFFDAVRERRVDRGSPFSAESGQFEFPFVSADSEEEMGDHDV